MTSTTALLGSALFLAVAPGTLAGLIPWLIVRWPAPTPHPWLAALGAPLLVVGAILLLDCFRRFALQGLGTPAPIAPPQRLIVTGAYRHLRNPMYVAVTALILGQAALFANLPVLIYGLLIWAASTPSWWATRSRRCASSSRTTTPRSSPQSRVGFLD